MARKQFTHDKFTSFAAYKWKIGSAWKKLRKLVSALKVRFYVQTHDKICLQQTGLCTVVVQPCVSILDRSRCIFALLHATGGCIDRSDTIARASLLRDFFSLSGSLPRLPPLSATALETHFYPGQFRRLLLTFLPRDRRTFHLACARARARSPPPVMRYIFYFIRVFSTSHAHLISCTVNHRDVNYSDFSSWLSRVAQSRSILDRVGQLCR